MGYLKLGRLVFKPSERALLLALLLCFQVNVVFFVLFFRFAGQHHCILPANFSRNPPWHYAGRREKCRTFSILCFSIPSQVSISYLCFEFISFRPFWWVAGITPLLGKKCWRSGESSRLSVLWFWFDSLVRLVYFLSRFRSKDFPRGSLIFRLT